MNMGRCGLSMKWTEVDVLKYAKNYMDYEIEEEGYIYFKRFLESQRAAYELNQMYRTGFAATTGICIHFVTNGDALKCDCKVEGAGKMGVFYYFTQPVTHYQLQGKAKRRKPPKTIQYGGADKYESQGFELVVDGESQGQKLPQNGQVEYHFANPGHEWKEVTLYLPQHAKAMVRCLTVNGMVREGTKQKGRMLALGDSITSGKQAQCASNSYVIQLASALGLEVVNQGVPGYTFFPNSLNGLENITFRPNLITVAYGTNDWGFSSSKEKVDDNIKAYFKKLNLLFADVLKVVITPIWRADEENPTHYGSLGAIRGFIKEQAECMDNTLVVEGENVLPNEIRYLRDGYVHPSDEGQRLYAERVFHVIREEDALKGIHGGLSSC